MNLKIISFNENLIKITYFYQSFLRIKFLFNNLAIILKYVLNENEFN